MDLQNRYLKQQVLHNRLTISKLSFLSYLQKIKHEFISSTQNAIIRFVNIDSDLKKIAMKFIEMRLQVPILTIKITSFRLGSKLLQKIGKKCRTAVELSLTGCNIGNKAIRIIKRIGFKFIKKIELNSNYIKEDGIRVLSLCELKQLQRINLDFNMFGNQGLCHIVKADWLQLRQISVKDCFFTSDAFKILLKSNWPYLRELSINYLGQKYHQMLTCKRFYKYYGINLSQNWEGEIMYGCHLLLSRPSEELSFQRKFVYKQLS